MPIDVVLQTIEGKRLAEVVPQGRTLLNRLLPLEDLSFPLLGCIDPYGNTIFNGNQMRLFLQEWDRLLQGVVDKDDTEFLLRIRGLAERCKSEPHVFLRFIGD
jgi:hypothetical protein